MGIVGKGGIRGHILNCGKLSLIQCIIMLRLSLAKPGNPAIVSYMAISDSPTPLRLTNA